jgi:hypothetical protein
MKEANKGTGCLRTEDLGEYLDLTGMTVRYRKLFHNLYSSIDTISMTEMKGPSDTQEMRNTYEVMAQKHEGWRLPM